MYAVCMLKIIFILVFLNNWITNYDEKAFSGNFFNISACYVVITSFKSIQN